MLTYVNLNIYLTLGASIFLEPNTKIIILDVNFIEEIWFCYCFFFFFFRIDKKW